MSTGSINKSHETENEVEVDWEIKIFQSHLKKNTTIRSPSFTWSSVSWEIEMRYNTSEDKIALYLMKTTTGTEISVIYKFGILLIDGTREMRSCLCKKNFPSNYGITEIILKSELEERKHEMLPAGILTFSCSIAHLESLTKPEKLEYASLDVLSSNLKALYGCVKTSDITIVVGGQTYPAHKGILSARSHVFAAMFQHDMEEAKTGIINVDDCDPESFKDFLLYLYTGRIENFSSDNVCHLYKTADKYNVEELKDFCIRYMKRNLSVENLFDIVTLAKQFDKTDLLSLSQEFFNRNAKEIIKEDGWEQFIKLHFRIANQLLMNLLDKIKIED